VASGTASELVRTNGTGAVSREKFVGSTSEGFSGRWEIFGGPVSSLFVARWFSVGLPACHKIHPSNPKAAMTSSQRNPARSIFRRCVALNLV
jgi:hypothetical protein